MTVTLTAEVEGAVGSGRMLDPDVGATLARDWASRHLPDTRVLETRTHTAWYRARDDVSVRLSVELEGQDGMGETLTLLVRSRDGRVTTSVFPDDPALPSLAAMLDPRSAGEVLARTVPVFSAEPTHRAGVRCEAALVHHPRSGACVLRYDLFGPVGPTHRQLYAKVYPSTAEARLSAVAHEAVGGRLLHGEGVVVRTPRLVGLDIDTRTVLLESLGAQDPRADAVPAVEAACVLRTLHGTTAPLELPEVTARDDLGRLRAELALVATGWPDLAARVAPQVDAAAEVLQGTPHGPAVLSHGDFTPSQLIHLRGGVIGLLDLDTARRCEPAADLGRYLAYASVRLARAETSRTAPEQRAAATQVLAATVLGAYGDGGGVEALVDRTHAHERLQLAGLALRATRRFKEERARLALALLDHASARRPS